MIKFFQKLKAKKGFTLVELIVVIAIIGVLAAILIPTMLGYVTSSRVTSADSTAASIKNSIDNFLTDADTAGYGMKQGTTFQEFDITVTKAAGATAGTWSISAGDKDNFKTGHATISWGSVGSGSTAETKSGKTSAESLLCIHLADLFPEITSGAIHVALYGGKCTAVAYTADQSTNLTEKTHYPEISSTGKFADVFVWDKTTAGVSSDGLIIGTAPKVAIG